MSKYTDLKFSRSFLHPRYWPTLLLFLLMYLISWLPYFMLFRLGQGAGRLAMKIMKRRHSLIEQNLLLCFPDMPSEERDILIKKNIDNTGLGLFETAMAWFWPDYRVARHTRYEGMEILEKLDQQGKGVLLIAVHSMNLELGARAMGLSLPGVGVYRPNDNPCYDYFQYKGRVRSNRCLIDRKDVKSMLKTLRKGERMWYAPDHDYGLRRSVFAPLFAVDKACTTTGTSLLVDASDCAVVPFAMVRESDSGRYCVKIFPALTDFPHKDPQAAAEYTNKIVEKLILQAPEQYMWLHRRFKHRPEGEPSLYH